MKTADKYRLAVTAVTGHVVISKPLKDGLTMSNDRRFVPDGEFIQALCDWCDHKGDALIVKKGGKPYLEIKKIGIIK